MRRLPPELLLDGLTARGVTLFAGVPCSYLGGLFRLLEREPHRYYPAANEGVALAIGCGAALGGTRSAVLVQNSGLGNLVNPLTSLAATYGLPVLLLVGYRGDPAGPADEPQHLLMGRTTEGLLDLLGVRYWRLDTAPDRLAPTLDAAADRLAAGGAAALLVGRHVLADAPGQRLTQPNGAAPARPCVDPDAALAAFAAALRDELVVATTGYLSRHLFRLADRPENFYMQGSMGHAISLGLGLARARPLRQVVVLDGDGACLMHLGALSTVAAAGPPNLAHVVLDNGAYESTGGQPSTSGVSRLDELALAAGYRDATLVEDARALPGALRAVLCQPGPRLLAIRVGAHTGTPPPRASATLAPPAIRSRFAAACGATTFSRLLGTGAT
jgi:phosphonopyruvate decarboxylase